jgi:sec-independent protein translocase protein TatB
MFDIGFFELLIIAVVALIVLGPERLPKAARYAGLWVRKARAQWYSVRSEFERELAADEMRRSIAAPVAEIRRDLESARTTLQETVGEAGKLREDLRESVDEARRAGNELQQALAEAESAATDDGATAAPEASDNDAGVPSQSSLFQDPRP